MKTVIEMAREAGAELAELPMMDAIVFSVDDLKWNSAALERLVELARADERERLATKLVQDFKGAFGDDTCASWAVWIKEQR